MDPIRDKKLRAAIERANHLAMELYDLVEPGMTIDFTFQKEGGLIVPGKPPSMKRLIVTKPILHLELSARPNEGGSCD